MGLMDKIMLPSSFTCERRTLSIIFGERHYRSFHDIHSINIRGYYIGTSFNGSV